MTISALPDADRSAIAVTVAAATEPEGDGDRWAIGFAVASAVVLRPTLKRLQQARPQDATINARGDSLVGRTIVLDAPILNGRGRVTVGDGSWTVTGPDMVAGSKVRVAAVNGNELSVVPAP